MTARHDQDRPAARTRVFLVDDHELLRRGLRSLLEPEDDLEVVGEAATVAEAVPAILAVSPDVAVLDARLPDGSGIDVCREVRAADPSVRVLVLTGYDDDETVVAAILAGAAGYVLKQIDGGSLVSGVRAVARGQTLMDPGLASRALGRARRAQEAPDELAHLTSQERRVLDLVAEGLTNRQVGERLHLAEKTVKNHVTSILAKLGVDRRTQAAVLASRLRHG